MFYTHALNSGPSECVARRALCSAVSRWFSDQQSKAPARDPVYQNQYLCCIESRLSSYTGDGWQKAQRLWSRFTEPIKVKSAADRCSGANSGQSS